MPCSYVQRLYFALKIFEDYVELGLEELGVLLHVRSDTVHIFKELCMAQLVYFIIAYGLRLHAVLYHCNILVGGGKCGNARAAECDFRG